MTERSKQIGYLFVAELQFRLVSAVRLAVTMEAQPLDLPIEWVHGRHRVRYNEVALRKDQAGLAAAISHHSATFLMAVAINDALKATVNDPVNSSDERTRNAFQIARLVRNAFAHGPFEPKWLIDRKSQNKIFSIDEVITLDTRDLNGKPFDWRHYGGPLALLRLCQFVRFEILKDDAKRPSDREVPLPNNVYYQQGDLILKRIDDLAAGS